jgi:hypothetical protein
VPGLAAEDISDLQHMAAIAAVSGGSDSLRQRHPPIDSAMEREALDRMRMSVSYTQPRMMADQHRDMPGSRGYHSSDSVSQLLEDEHEGVDEQDAESLQDAEQIAEVLAAIEQQQAVARTQHAGSLRAAAAGAGNAAAVAEGEGEGGAGDDGSSWQQPSEEASLPADPWDMSDGECGATDMCSPF